VITVDCNKNLSYIAGLFQMNRGTTEKEHTHCQLPRQMSE